MKSPEEIVAAMMEKDALSQFLGISISKIEKGHCEITMTVTSVMTNGFEIAHGGITYSLGDSTLAFASNSRGKQCVSIDTSITHLSRVLVGDVLVARSREIHARNQIAVYEVDILNQNQKKVAHFKGTVKVTDNFW